MTKIDIKFWFLLLRCLFCLFADVLWTGLLMVSDSKSSISSSFAFHDDELEKFLNK